MQPLTVKSKSVYSVSIPSDTYKVFQINGICCLPIGQVIVADYHNKKVKLLDQHYNVSSHCDVSGHAWDICQITSSMVTVTGAGVQFLSVSNENLVS
ncbi:hypothetical protein DPMN_108460 [Dreissena polymorpha]|uniref:Uncharacterized protein n=1 Tax=Dreissena polymorpha TaxID=45954 RepID=A0A9D4K8S8_DREPO|nr:hypothetical protein DPMN_108460 [Dreissena polymorpha]